MQRPPYVKPPCCDHQGFAVQIEEPSFARALQVTGTPRAPAGGLLLRRARAAGRPQRPQLQPSRRATGPRMASWL